MRFWCKEKFYSRLRVERMRARTTPEATLSLCLVFVRLFRELEGGRRGGILLWGREGGKGGGGGGERGKPEGGIFLPFFLPPFLSPYIHRQVPRAFILKSWLSKRGGKFKSAPPFERTRKKDISLFLFEKVCLVSFSHEQKFDSNASLHVIAQPIRDDTLFTLSMSSLHVPSSRQSAADTLVKPFFPSWLHFSLRRRVYRRSRQNCMPSMPSKYLIYWYTWALGGTMPAWLQMTAWRHWRLPRYTRRRNKKWSQEYIKNCFLRHAVITAKMTTVITRPFEMAGSAQGGEASPIHVCIGVRNMNDIQQNLQIYWRKFCYLFIYFFFGLFPCLPPKRTLDINKNTLCSKTCGVSVIVTKVIMKNIIFLLKKICWELIKGAGFHPKGKS